MSTALRYDDATSRLELLTAGQSLKFILQAFNDIRQCIQTSRDLRDVLLDVGTFFRQMHEVFSRCRVEKNHQGLVVLLNIISDSMSCMDSKQRNTSIKSLLSDILGCLSYREVRETAEALMLNISKTDSTLQQSLTMEMEHILIHSRDAEVVEAVKSASAKVMGNSLSVLVPDSSVTNPATARSMHKSGGSSSSSSSSENGSTKSAQNIYPGSPRGIMKLSFLPHSITEQWLLAQGEDELRFVLEEITAVYNSLQPHAREAHRADMPVALRQVLGNCATGGKLVVVNGLKLISSIVEHSADAFADDLNLLDSLLPKVELYLAHSVEKIRHCAFRIAVPLVAKLAFQKTSQFVLNIIEDEDFKYYENVLKIAGTALLALSKDRLKEGTAAHAAIKGRVGRIGKAALKHLLKKKEKEKGKSGKSVAEKSADEDEGGKPVISAKDSVLQYLAEVAKDVLAACLLILCPPGDSNGSVYTSLLPSRFLDALLVDNSENFIDNMLQAEITIRASGLTFPSLATDADVSMHITRILDDRAKLEIQEKKLLTSTPTPSPAKQSVATGTGKKSIPVSGETSDTAEKSGATQDLSQTWPQNATLTPAAGVKAKASNRQRLFDSSPPLSIKAENDANNDVTPQRTLSYVPSWSGAEGESMSQGMSATAESEELTVQLSQLAMARSMMSHWAPNEPEVDRSKLSALKSSRRTPGSRRAHSAEYTSDRTLFNGEISSPAPSTSDGIRHASSKKEAASGNGEDDALAMSTRGNYMADGPVEMRVSPLKLPNQRRSRKLSDEDMVFETTEYQISCLPVRDARDNSDDNSAEGYRFTQSMNGGIGGSSGRVKNSPRQPLLQYNGGAGATAGSDSNGSSSQQQQHTIPFLKRGEGKARRDERLAAASTLLESDAGIYSPQHDRQREREREWEMGMGDLHSRDTGLGSILAEHGRSSKRSTVQHSPRLGADSHRDRGAFDDSSPPPQRRAGADRAVVQQNRGNVSPRQERGDRDSAQPPSNKRNSNPARSNPNARAQNAEESAAPDGSRMAPSALMPESLEYLDRSEIIPCDNAKQQLAKILKELDTGEWPGIFHTLNTVRRLALHHQNLILGTSKTTLHGIFQSVLRHADNLRSQVSKNAILTIADMYAGFGKGVDGEVFGAIALLTKKCADSATTFVGASAEYCICQVVEHATPFRVLASLLNCTDNRNPALRARVSGFLQLLVSTRGNELRGSREIDALKSKLTNMLNDNTPDSRAFSRDIVRQLIEQNICSRAELEQRVPADLVTKALSMPAHGAMSPIRSKPGDVSPSRGLSSRRRAGASSARTSQDLEIDEEALVREAGHMSLTLPSDEEYNAADEDELENSASGLLLGGGGGSGGKKKKVKRAVKKNAAADPLESSNDMSGSTPSRAKASAAKRIMDRNEDLVSLPDQYVALQSSMWTDRRDALTQITDIVIKYMTVLRDASKLNGCLDRLLETLEDGSVKVVLHSLQCVSRIHDDAPSILSSAQHVVLPAMLSVASSSNKQVCTAAAPVLKEMIASLPLQKVIQQLCQTAMHDKDRLKVLAFRLLRDCIGKLHESSENMASSLAIRKMIFPTICHVMLGNKQTVGEVRVAAGEALKEIQRGCAMGEKVSKWAETPSEQEELGRILRS